MDMSIWSEVENMCKSFLTLDKKMFDDVVDLICCKCSKMNTDGIYVCGAVLNCIFCFFAIEQKQKIEKETENIYNKINEQIIKDNRSNTCKIRTPIICDKNKIEFVFINKSDICNDYLPNCLANVDYHENYAYYQVCGITSTEKTKYKELPLHVKRIINKKAISKIGKADIIAEFYTNLFEILQLHPDRICDYIQCLEMLFFLLDDEYDFCENISDMMKNEAIDTINKRKRNVYKKNNGEYFIYNIFIQTMNNLDESIIFKIDKFRSRKCL